MKKKWSSNLIISIVVTVIAMIYIVAIIAFDVSNTKNIEQHAYEILNEATENNISAMNERIKMQKDYLTAIASYKSKYPEDEIYDLLPLFEELVKEADFEMIAVADLNGYMRSADSVTTTVSDRIYFQDAINKGFGIQVVDFGRITKATSIAFGIPIYNGKKEITNVLVSSNPVSSFEKAIESQIFNGETTLALYNKAGKSLYTTNEDLNIDFPGISNNLFAFLAEYQINSEYSEIEYHDIFSTKDTKMMAFRYNNKTYYAINKATGIADINIVNFVSRDVVFAEYNFILTTMFITVIVISILFAILVGMVILVESRHRKAMYLEQEQLKIEDERYRIIENMTNSVLVDVDVVKDTIKFSDRYESVFGHKGFLEKFSDYSLPNKYIHPDDMNKFVIMGDYIYHKRSSRSLAETDIRIMGAEGKYILTHADVVIVRDKDSRAIRAIIRLTDASARMKKINELQDKAEKDSLVDIYNRGTIQKMIDSFLLAKGRNGEHALFVLDVDHFKQINDNFGHLVGDNVLVQVGKCLKELFYATDIVGRLGGDEFAIFLRNISSVEAISRKAEEICKKVSSIEGLNITCSIGIALYNSNELNFNELYARADKVLYNSKNSGGNVYMFYEEKTSK